MEKILTVAGSPIRIRDTYGEGTPPAPDDPVLVLLHGYLETIEVWDAMIPHLRDRVRVIAMDLPGHGRSPATDRVESMPMLSDALRGVLGQLGVRRIFLAGHSMGGYAALEFLKRYPQMLEGLVLFESTPNADDEEKRQQRLREIEVVRSGHKDMLAITIEKAFAQRNRKAMKKIIAKTREAAASHDSEGIAALLRGMMDRADNNGIMLASRMTPKLMVFGRHDELLTPELAGSVIAKQPGSEVAWLEDSGHMGPLEEPARSAEIILSFIDRHRKA